MGGGKHILRGLGPTRYFRLLRPLLVFSQIGKLSSWIQLDRSLTQLPQVRRVGQIQGTLRVSWCVGLSLQRGTIKEGGFGLFPFKPTPKRLPLPKKDTLMLCFAVFRPVASPTGAPFGLCWKGSGFREKTKTSARAEVTQLAGYVVCQD